MHRRFFMKKITAAVCALLKQCGFTLLRCADRMLDDGGHGTTWFIIATKPI